MAADLREFAGSTLPGDAERRALQTTGGRARHRRRGIHPHHQQGRHRGPVRPAADRRLLRPQLYVGPAPGRHGHRGHDVRDAAGVVLDLPGPGQPVGRQPSTPATRARPTRSPPEGGPVPVRLGRHALRREHDGQRGAPAAVVWAQRSGVPQRVVSVQLLIGKDALTGRRLVGRTAIPGPAARASPPGRQPARSP